MKPDEPTITLPAWLAWLHTEDCPCSYRWKSYGRLYGISMGKGWVRMDTHPDCPHHDVPDRP